MRVYLSTSSADLDTARQLMASVEAAGHEITLDWTQSFGTPQSVWNELADHELQVVARSQVVLLVGPPTTGCIVEIGAALVSGVPIVWHCSPDEFIHRHFFLRHDLVYGSHGGISHAIKLVNWLGSVLDAEV